MNPNASGSDPMIQGTPDHGSADQYAADFQLPDDSWSYDFQTKANIQSILKKVSKIEKTTTTKQDADRLNAIERRMDELQTLERRVADMETFNGGTELFMKQTQDQVEFLLAAHEKAALEPSHKAEGRDERST